MVGNSLRNIPGCAAFPFLFTGMQPNGMQPSSLNDRLDDYLDARQRSLIYT